MTTDIIKIDGIEFKKILDCGQIDSRVAEMSAQLNKDIKSDNPLFVCMLCGGVTFCMQLMTGMDKPYELAFIKWSSYSGDRCSGIIREQLPLTADVKGRDVIFVDDMVDSGNTMSKFRDYVLDKGAKSFKSVVLLRKPGNMMKGLNVDYYGFDIANGFVVGHGFEYNDKGRGLKDIYQK